jgi:hypothetical protein
MDHENIKVKYKNTQTDSQESRENMLPLQGITLSSKTSAPFLKILTLSSWQSYKN